MPYVKPVLKEALLHGYQPIKDFYDIVLPKKINQNQDFIIFDFGSVGIGILGTLR